MNKDSKLVRLSDDTIKWIKSLTKNNKEKIATIITFLLENGEIDSENFFEFSIMPIKKLEKLNIEYSTLRILESLSEHLKKDIIVDSHTNIFNDHELNSYYRQIIKLIHTETKAKRILCFSEKIGLYDPEDKELCYPIRKNYNGKQATPYTLIIFLAKNQTANINQLMKITSEKNTDNLSKQIKTMNKRFRKHLIEPEQDLIVHNNSGYVINNNFLIKMKPNESE